MQHQIKLVSLGIVLLCLCYGVWFLYTELYRVSVTEKQSVSFEVKTGESVTVLAKRLEQEGVIRMPRLFAHYVAYKGYDTQIHAGTYTVDAPVTLAHVAEALKKTAIQQEREITILPGWTLRDIGEYLETQGVGNSTDFFALVGQSADQDAVPSLRTELAVTNDKPTRQSFEAYLAPETYRVFVDASLESIVTKLINHRNDQFTDQMYQDIKKSRRTVYEVMIMASIVEKEVRSSKDKAMVADLFWRRYDHDWALQADSTVHYIFAKKGNVFTTANERNSLSPWNTYKYPGLPQGPISTPSLETIMATIYPEQNDYWYFLTDMSGNVHYGKTLEEHNANIQKYLR